MERLWEAEHSDQWDNLIVKCILDGGRKWVVWWEQSINKTTTTGEISRGCGSGDNKSMNLENRTGVNKG